MEFDLVAGEWQFWTIFIEDRAHVVKDDDSRMKFSGYFSLLKRVPLKHLSVDLLLMSATLPAALWLRVGPEAFPPFLPTLIYVLAASMIIRVLFMIGFGCYSIMWRYVSTVDAVRLVEAIAASTGLLVLIAFFLNLDPAHRLPRSVYFIDALLVVLGLMGSRLFRRLLYEGRAARQTRGGKRTLIYGAGQNGRLLAHRFKSDASLDTHVVGFLDDDMEKADLVINGVPVLGDIKVVEHVIEKFRISQIIVAIPKVSGDFLLRLVAATRPYNIKPRLTTQMSSVAEQNGKRVEIIRDVALPDLLNRPARDIDLHSIREMVRGRCVLVTGAGGSIGSELARQIMANQPSRLLLLDHSEFNLYEIDKELRLSTHDVQHVVPLLIDLKDEASVTSAMREFTPDIVFHAAAYKHVHLVESNPFSSILNNIEGTRILLDACKAAKVSTFVMISTDKAVNPAGVMGATKRVCELLVTSAAVETGRRYCSVRFGNVLGSSGSLIPLLQQQIETGGPVTITHAEMTRFFMLIPEAVSLVLKVAMIAQPGDINVLRMGEPVRIVDIARNLIALMGRTEEEVPIVFTGLRPGEKMFEELYIRGDELKTDHPDILTIPNGDSSIFGVPSERQRMHEKVRSMVTMAQQGAKDALYVLNELVKSNYTPAPEEQKDNGTISFLSRIQNRH